MQEFYEQEEADQWAKRRTTVGINVIEKWIRKYGKKKIEEMRKKIERSRSLKQYNKWKTKVEQNSEKRREKSQSWKQWRDFRRGNEWEWSRYWVEVNRKMCRLCEKKKESWQHIWRKCKKSEAMNITKEEIIAEESKGMKWVLEIGK